MLALFAYQTTALAWVECVDLERGRPEAATAHEQHDSPNSPNVVVVGTPTSNRDANAEHTVPVDLCGLAGGCVVAVPGAPPQAGVLRSALAREFRSPDGLILSPAFAPDTPPPRA